MSRVGLLFGVSLVAAGLSQGTRASAAAPADGPGEILLLKAMVGQLTPRLLPISFELPQDRDPAPGSLPTTLILTEIRYCGALENGRARLLAVARAGLPSGLSPTPLLSEEDSDCQQSLADIARRDRERPPGSAAAVIAEVLVSWVPWQLRLALGEVAVGGDVGAAAGVEAGLKRLKASGKPLDVVETSALRVMTDRGGSLTFNLAVDFLRPADSVLVTLVPADQVSAWSSRRAAAARTELRDPRAAAAAPPGSNAIVSAPYPFANTLLALFAQDGPLVIEAEKQKVEVRGLQMTGGEGNLTVRGTATPRAVRESARLSILSSGADLGIADVRAEAQLEDCAALSALAAIGCRARNAARSATAAALASGLVSRYRGQPLRTLARPGVVPVELGTRRHNVRLSPNRTRSTAAALIVYGRVEVE
jgi:hypothetical protein